MTTEKSLCKIDYVYLEMILNKENNYEVVSGLFKGIVEQKGDKFVLLHGLKDSTNVLNLKFYNIMTIEERTDDFKNMTYLTAKKVDQNLALTMLEAFYEKFTDAGYVLKNDPVIIDVKKFTEVPDEYLEGKPTSSGTAQSSSSGVGSFASSGKNYSRATSTYTKPDAKKDPEPTVFGRVKGKKPAKNALENLQEKLNQIREGAFEPVLPETLGDVESTVADDEDEDEDDPYSHTPGYSGIC